MVYSPSLSLLKRHWGITNSFSSLNTCLKISYTLFIEPMLREVLALLSQFAGVKDLIDFIQAGLCHVRWGSSLKKIEKCPGTDLLFTQGESLYILFSIAFAFLMSTSAFVWHCIVFPGRLTHYQTTCQYCVSGFLVFLHAPIVKTEQLVLPNIMFVPEAATPHRVHMGLVMQHPWRWLWSKYCPNISLSQLTSCAQWHLQDHRLY